MSVRFDIHGMQRLTLAPMCWLTILIGLSVPVSVAFDNVLLGLLLLGSLASIGSIAEVARTHPVARAALLLFVLLSVAMLYGEASLKEAFAILAKYVDLLFIPAFIFLLASKTAQRRARYAFLSAMAGTLILSYFVGLELIQPTSWMDPYATFDNPIIFHSHIAQNNMMAFAAFLALLEVRAAVTLLPRFIWALFALLAAVNVLFMVQGRTGYLILLALASWFTWSTLSRYRNAQGKTWGWRHGLVIMGGVVVLGLVAYHTSARLHDRVALVISEYQAWSPGNGKGTSIEARLDFYYNTLQIVLDHPLAGVGTGGFPDAYKRQVQDSKVLLTNNPHNEYLLIAVQTGLIGLALLLYLFYVLWRYAPLLPAPLEQDAARGLVLAYMVNCMFNSALHDHSDGLLFAFMTAALFAGLKREPEHD